MLQSSIRKYQTIVQFGQMASYSSGAARGSLRSKYLIGTEEVANLLKDAPENLRIINATWFMPNANMNALKLH